MIRRRCQGIVILSMLLGAAEIAWAISQAMEPAPNAPQSLVRPGTPTRGYSEAADIQRSRLATAVGVIESPNVFQSGAASGTSEAAFAPRPSASTQSTGSASRASGASSRRSPRANPGAGSGGGRPSLRQTPYPASVIGGGVAGAGRGRALSPRPSPAPTPSPVVGGIGAVVHAGGGGSASPGHGGAAAPAGGPGLGGIGGPPLLSGGGLTGGGNAGGGHGGAGHDG